MTSPVNKSEDLAAAAPPTAGGGGFMGRLRRFSHDILEKPDRVGNADMQRGIEELVTMGFPRGPATRQMQITNGNVQGSAEALVHAAHGTTEWGGHPDCPICVRETENVRISEGRRLSVSDALHRITSRGKSQEGEAEHGWGNRAAGDGTSGGRRGSVGAMLRRASVAEGLRRMTTRDTK
ncbi:uncharacterized protein EHS24_000564 [Apiotrichum porosum]|uniref:UBA domain-containing protein n=1 Tax=Apiotrichum porosum TaxID=105984 RepID=A0A427YA55_9TREE|nr:uncharacterized protein EHS24_000564 [Apiotrichum porosum]RSH88039.1 hypothetical protein EHS24_000564 [Apiotrichum porosum]